MTIDVAAVRQDLYQAVNGDWVKQAQIPADKPATGGFNDLVDGIEKQLMADLDAMLTTPPTDAKLQQAVQLYALAKDFARREQEGVAPLQARLAEIEALNSYADVQPHLVAWTLSGEALPVAFDVDADMKNAQVNALFAGAPGLILPDKTYYDSTNEQGPQLLAVWRQMTTKLLAKLGYSAADQQRLVEQTIAFDARIAPHVKSREEAADYSKMYNPQSLAEFVGHTTQLDLQAWITALLGQTPTQVIVTEPEYYAVLDGLLRDHFAEFKAWLLVNRVLGEASFLTDECRILAGEYGRALSGSQAPISQAKSAYYLTNGYFSQVVGGYYAQRYFGAQAKADVEHMVHQMIAVYKAQLQANDWLSPATRQKAITKLDHLGVQVGYPDQIPALYDQLQVDPHQTLLANVLALTKEQRQDLFARFNQPVDRLRWEMSPATVNAYFHPFKNIIVFPAAVLQAPFYSLTQSSSQNYGGIGAVIAHEISHAFDNNGALFDEYGNLSNWWTAEDAAHFKQLAQRMIDEFDGLPFAGQTVNGKLTVSENIADAGGLSCALSAAKTEADFDAQAFFINWARVWRTKARKEYQQLLLAIDVHAPQKLRANVQVQNLADFYQAFGVQPGDPMYLAPDQRVNIW
ncbi:M13 family metallopeptidase [Limosilactobacillus ingluviei]|uniref:M13 family metallopeptidase n=1 Tax=Limosilactobacillus ingluviei TaxID=148604 RepID=UPI0023EF9F39|nr:M13-type metalloendopeptidase [Limosilactobacillus ingluviei]